MENIKETRKKRSSQSDSLPRMNPTEREGKLVDAKSLFTHEDLQKKYGQLIQEQISCQLLKVCPRQSLGKSSAH